MTVKENIEKSIDRYFDSLKAAIEEHADKYTIMFYKNMILCLHEQYIKYCEKSGE